MNEGLGFLHKAIKKRLKKKLKKVKGLVGGGGKKRRGKKRAAAGPWTGAVPFAAPPGTTWVNLKGHPKLMIPGGAIARRVIAAKLKAAGYSTAVPTPTAGPEAGLDPAYTSTPMPAMPVGPYAPQGGPFYGSPSSIPSRSVWGEPHTPFSQLEVFPDAGEAPPWEDADEGTAWDDDPGGAWGDAAMPATAGGDWDMDNLDEEYGGPYAPGLYGTDDDPGFLRRKWDEAIAWLQAKIAGFFQLKADLYSQRRLAEAAFERAKRVGDTGAASKLAGLLKDIEAAIAKQEDLEGKVSGALQKAGLVKGEGLGALPIVITVGAIAAVVAVGGAVVIHTQHVRQLRSELELAAKRVLTPAQIAAIKGAGPLGGLGQALASLPLLIVGGVALVYLLKK